MQSECPRLFTSAYSARVWALHSLTLIGYGRGGAAFRAESGHSDDEGVVFSRLIDKRLLGLAAMSGWLTLFGLSGPVHADIGPYVLVDAATGTVLEEHEATRPWYPASLTKMMTAYVTLKALREGRLDLNSPVTQSANSIAQPPSKMGFKVGTQLTLETALTILMVKSANDMAVAIAETVGGTEENFISMMNAEAQRLGMRSTRFVNPHGLPDNRQVTSAADLAILAIALKRDFPDAHHYYGHPGLKFGKQMLRSANREFLQRVPGADGLKTGYICNSGYNVAASATRNGRTVIAVVLGAGSGLERTAFTREVIDRGFRLGGRGQHVSTLPPSGAGLPADGYCKRNPKLGPEEILARYDIKAAGKTRSAVMFQSSGEGRPVIAVPAGDAEPGEEGAEFSSKPGKVNWNMVLDRTVGTELVAYAPVTVRTGLPKGAAPAVAAPVVQAAPVAAAAAAAAEIPSVRLPASKPLDLRPSAVVPGAAGDAPQAAPAFGSLFNGNVPASAVPRAKNAN